MFGRASKKSNNTKYYEILGISKTISEEDLKKAYKKATIKNHPDKGSGPEKVNKASIIVDATKYIKDLKQKLDETLNVQEIFGITNSAHQFSIEQNDQSPVVFVQTLEKGFQINVYSKKNCRSLAKYLMLGILVQTLFN